MPPQDNSARAKAAALREEGTLNPAPEKIGDPTFHQSDFFDPRDLVQVKYEMLRRHRVEGRAVSRVAAGFGVSRQAFYTAQAAFRAQGIPGLLPRPRGPRRAHKCPLPLACPRRSQWHRHCFSRLNATLRGLPLSNRSSPRPV